MNLSLEELIETRAAEPFGVTTSTTPSGLEIYFQAGPKRLYRVRDVINDDGPWVEVPSVSTVLDCLEKGGLSWWGMKVGVEGFLRLYEEGVIAADYEGWLVGPPPECFPGVSSEQVVDLLKAHKLTVNDVKGKAADRGTNVHSALETWVDTGVTPDPRFFPEHERGYVEGLVAFINDAHPVPLAAEVMVGSLEHEYAGRFDLLANIAGEVVTKTYPKRNPIRENVGGVWLLDLKTSKSVYSTYHLQLAAYRHAMGECGYDNADEVGVVRVTDDGRYELVKGIAGFDDFLAILGAYRALRRLK